MLLSVHYQKEPHECGLTKDLETLIPNNLRL